MHKDAGGVALGVCSAEFHVRRIHNVRAANQTGSGRQVNQVSKANNMSLLSDVQLRTDHGVRYDARGLIGGPGQSAHQVIKWVK